MLNNLPLQQRSHERASLLGHNALPVLLYLTDLCQETRDEAFEVRR
jgi:hypothetical protein